MRYDGWGSATAAEVLKPWRSYSCALGLREFKPSCLTREVGCSLVHRCLRVRAYPMRNVAPVRVQKEGGKRDSPNNIRRAAPEGSAANETSVECEREQLDEHWTSVLVGNRGQEDRHALQPDVVGEPPEA